MHLTIITHEKCFDGVACAALFTRFWRDRVARDAEIEIRFVNYGSDKFRRLEQLAWAAPGEVAILDFSYSASPRVTWWFDHHEGAFETAEDGERFERDRSERQAFDVDARSCAGLLARTLAERFGYRAENLGELVEWADVIDAARWESEAIPVEARSPALRVRLVVESSRDQALVAAIARGLERESIDALVRTDWFQAAEAPLRERHQELVEAFRRTSVVEGGVVFSDLIDDQVIDERYEKCIPYFLFPGTPYNVAVLRTSRGFKISAGHNTCSRTPNLLNLGALCKPYKGGGHPGVGAITRGDISATEAREIAAVLVEHISASLSTEREAPPNAHANAARPPKPCSPARCDAPSGKRD